MTDQEVKFLLIGIVIGMIITPIIFWIGGRVGTIIFHIFN